MIEPRFELPLVPLVVPNHLKRKLGGAKDTGGTGPDGIQPKVGGRARVGGLWDHKHMDDDTWGIHVQRAERLNP